MDKMNQVMNGVESPGLFLPGLEKHLKENLKDIEGACDVYDKEIDQIRPKCHPPDVQQPSLLQFGSSSGCSAQNYQACSGCEAKQNAYNAQLDHNTQVCKIFADITAIFDPIQAMI